MVESAFREKFSALTNEEVISEFAKNLLAEKGLKTVNDDIKKDILILIEEKLTDTINEALIYALPDEKIVELEKLADRDDVTARWVTDLIMNSGIDVNGIIMQTMSEFRESFLKNKLNGEQNDAK